MESLKLESLTVEQKIGQMLLCRGHLSDNKEDKKFILDLVKNRALGGIQTRVDVKEYLSVADYPMLVCENMENGYESPGSVKFPCQQAIGATNREESAYEAARITAIQAKADGLNLVFGPIFDIAMNPLSSCVGPRSFGGNKELVAKMAVAAVKGYQEQGMLVTGKHYPGFGESAVDSHIGMVYLTCDEQLLLKRELYPYLKTIREANLSGVMTGHIMVPKIDPKYPASISKKLIGILRNKLKYDGLVMTDSLAMVGLTNLFGLDECHGLAMAAGNDMVMTSYRIPTKEAYGYMMKAYKKGIVSMEQIDNAVRRVLEAQAKTLKPPKQKVLTEREKTTALSISEKAITTLLSGAKSAVIPAKDKHLFVLQVGNSFVEPQTGKLFKEYPEGEAQIEKNIKKLFPNSAVWKINDYPSRDQMQEALAETMKYESVVLVAFSRTREYTGSSDISQRLMAFIYGISHKLSGIILFGNAYAAREFPKVPRIIFGYEGGNCTEDALKVLSGQIKPQGKLPLSLSLDGRG